MTTTLRLLGGGAAHGLVSALAPAFEAETGCRIEGTFGAVGAMRDRLLDGEPTDLVILTASLIRDLAALGHVSGADAVAVGTVETAIAVRAGDPAPAVGDGEALRAAFLDADAIYLPDTAKSTAGLHLAAVIASLGLRDSVAGRLREHSNGATAMRALAASTDRRPIGSTQVTEILATPGIALVGPLPPEHGLATIYTAAPCTKAALADAARAFIRRLAGPEAAGARATAGFAA